MSSCRPTCAAWITDPAGADAYPIVTYTWLLCYKKYQDPKIAQTLKSVIQYGLDQGPEVSASNSATFRCRPTSSTPVTKALEQIS